MTREQRKQQFIIKAHKTHDNKYDYSKSEYINTTTKITVICPEHGEFNQRPEIHLKGRGCPKCGIIKAANKERLGKEKFIQKAEAIHGNKYNYNKIKYINNNIKIKIYCKKCKKYFHQSPISHLKGYGCNQCTNNKKRHTKEKFIQKAKTIHGNKYNYNQINYKNYHIKLKIYCNKCKKYFKQSPANHLSGKGCPNCSIKLMIEKFGYTKKQFIQKAKKIHGNKYDYTKSKYKNYHTRLKIYCNKCKKYFWQIPLNHLKGKGCWKCSPSRRRTKEKFIKQAKIIHGNKYTYNQINYKNNNTKIKIYCKKCKKYFYQSPSNHLNGKGCKRCAGTNLQTEIYDYIHIITQEEILYNDKKAIQPYELDIYIPAKSIAIEVQGLYWHSYLKEPEEKHINKHINKYTICKEKGITLIQVYENEWRNKKEIVKTILKRYFESGNYNNILEIKYDEASKLILDNTLQKPDYADLYYTYNNSLMSFKLENDQYKIINYYGSKLNNMLAHFIKKYNPKSITVEVDNRYPNNCFADFGFVPCGFSIGPRKQFISKYGCYYDFVDDFSDRCRIIWDAGLTYLEWKQKYG